MSVSEIEEVIRRQAKQKGIVTDEEIFAICMEFGLGLQEINRLEENLFTQVKLVSQFESAEINRPIYDIYLSSLARMKDKLSQQNVLNLLYRTQMFLDENYL